MKSYRIVHSMLLPLTLAFVVAAVRTDVEHQTNKQASDGAALKSSPGAMSTDAATAATFTLVDGQIGGESGNLAKLHDGRLPYNQDDPQNNFFFAIDTLEGRFKVDFAKPISIGRITTFSWHKDVRAPQLFKVYASNGGTKDFDAAPKIGTDPAKCGWTRIASIDTRPKTGRMGGRDVLNIHDDNPSKPLGTYQYLLFVCFATEVEDGWGHTFFSELDVVEQGQSAK